MFAAVRREVKTLEAESEAVRQLCLKLGAQEHDVERALQTCLAEGNKLSSVLSPRNPFHAIWRSHTDQPSKTLSRLHNNQQCRPGFLCRVLGTQAARQWDAFQAGINRYHELRTDLVDLKSRIDGFRSRYGRNLLSPDFFTLPHEQRQIVSPWVFPELSKKREELFEAALEIHRTFVGVNAQKLLHNLSVTMMILQGQYAPDEAKRKLLPDLWSSLFLIVPVVSTTFASIWNMIGNLPDESIGWLLVDEAGQATPQSAVGAIRRARNVVVVGDPIQIQPVVTLPDQLVVQISDYFSVDANLWAAPHASVQTLADRVSPCQSEFRSESGLRKVGSPLLVHRRCESPMFDISNMVAYSGQMVNQVSPTDGGAIRQSLGPSRWINIEGDANSKWCQAEGSAVIDLFRKLKEDGVSSPDVFIVSPFRIVAEEMRRLCRTQSTLFRAINLDVDEFCRTRIGTVHTVQGREADTVIFLLGAPMQHQAGARSWAGSPENLLNVAVSRSKRNLYVIGSRAAWMRSGCFVYLASAFK